MNYRRLFNRFVALLVAVVCFMAICLPASAAQTNPFTDVPSDQYYYDPVLWAVSEKITTGTTVTTFSPNATCTRAQAVTFLWRSAGEPAPATTVNPFTDVKADEYYYKAVLWAVEKGITTGTTATTFDPNGTVLREHFVTFLWRMAGKPAPSKASVFTDLVKDAYYCDAAAWANEKGYCKGLTETTFGPRNSCTRGQTVTFLYRYYNTGVVTPSVPSVPSNPSNPSDPITPIVPGTPSNPSVNPPAPGPGIGGEYETSRDYT